jgi:hypothetical protein
MLVNICGANRQLVSAWLTGTSCTADHLSDQLLHMSWTQNPLVADERVMPASYAAGDVNRPRPAVGIPSAHRAIAAAQSMGQLQNVAKQTHHAITSDAAMAGSNGV